MSTIIGEVIAALRDAAIEATVGRVLRIYGRLRGWPDLSRFPDDAKEVQVKP